MSCQHNTQARMGDFMWCRACGGIRQAAAADWSLPAFQLPQSAKEILKNLRDKLESSHKAQLTAIDAAIFVNDEDTEP
jgi:hypothetical protein